MKGRREVLTKFTCAQVASHTGDLVLGTLNTTKETHLAQSSSKTPFLISDLQDIHTAVPADGGKPLCVGVQAGAHVT